MRDVWAPADGDALDRTAFSLLVVLAAFAPWLSATILPATLAGGLPAPVGVQVLTAIALCIGTTTFLSRSCFRPFRPLALPAWGLAALTLFGALQMVPLPEPVLSLIAPVNQQIYHEIGGLFALFERTPAPLPRITIAPRATILSTLQLAGFLVLALSAWSLLRNRPRRRFLAAVVILSAVGQVAGLALSGGRIFAGVWQSRSEFPTYLLVILPMAFGVAWAEVITGSDRYQDSDRGQMLADRLGPLVLRGVGWLVLLAGIAFFSAADRFLAAAAGTFVMGGLLLRVRAGRLPTSGQRWAVSAACLGVAAATLWLFRFGSGLDERAVPVWRAGIEAWKSFPFVGAGFGAFADAFRRVQPRSLPGLIEDPGSDLLQLLVEGGIAAALLAAITVLSLFWSLLRRWKTQRHREESALALAGIGVVASLTIDGVWHSNLSSPAVAATAACVIGLALASGNDASALRSTRMDG